MTWFNRNFSDPNAISLFMSLVLGLLFIEFFGQLFLPALIAVVIAYLLNSVVKLLERWKFPHLLAVTIVFLLFIGFVAYILVGLMPSLWKQLVSLLDALPKAFHHSQGWLKALMRKHPLLFSNSQFQHLAQMAQEQSAKVGQYFIQFTLASIPNVIQAVLYLVLVPLLVFFFLKDGAAIIHWFNRFMPSNRSAVLSVWSEVNEKIACYVRGRVTEIIIISIVSCVAFYFLGLQYAILLGVLVGLSVIIPYIGAVMVTIPIVIIGLLQWGFAPHFWYLMATYALIIILDANLLVPILFSETMDLHPVVIIMAVVVFGSFWGFWGVFFAIPLATLFNAVLHAWPRANKTE